MIESALGFVVFVAAVAIVALGIPGLMLGIVITGVLLAGVVATLTFGRGLWRKLRGAR